MFKPPLRQADRQKGHTVIVFFLVATCGAIARAALVGLLGWSRIRRLLAINDQLFIAIPCDSSLTDPS